MIADAALAACASGDPASAKKAQVTQLAWCSAQAPISAETGLAGLAVSTTSVSGCPVAGTLTWSAPGALRVTATAPQWLDAGSSVAITTSDLAAAGNPSVGTYQDTLIYLLRCASTGCDSGEIVAIDDDGNTATPQSYDSRIDASSLPAGLYFALVTAYGPAGQGTATLTWQVNGGAPVIAPQTVFGGLEALPEEVRRGDVLLVGKSPDSGELVRERDSNGDLVYPGLAADPDYPDSVAWVLSTRATGCPAGPTACGSYWRNDDAWWYGSIDKSVLLSRIILGDISAEAPLTQARVLAGPYDPWVADGPAHSVVRSMNLRAMHLRTHAPAGAWDCPEQLDHDGDGLPWELERVLGSCDLVTDLAWGDMGATGLSCQAWADAMNTRVNEWYPQGSCAQPQPCPVPAGSTQGPERCWSARDSDNDGMADLAEVWAMAAHFAAAPSGPEGAVGAPTALDVLDVSPACPDVWCVGENLSARSDPEPYRYDIYLQLDAVNCTGSHCASVLQGQPTSHALLAEQSAPLYTFWSDTPWRRWDGAAPPYVSWIAPDRELAYLIRMHAYPGTVHDLPDTLALGEAQWQGARAARSFFDAHFDLVWKALRLGRYGLLMPNQGQTTSGVVVSSNHTGTAQHRADQVINPLSHEIGHLLGLAHPHDNWVRPDFDCDGSTSESAGKCSISTCPPTSTDPTCECTPYAAAACQAGPSPNNGPNNPAVPSLMNYRFAGALAPGSAAPVFAYQYSSDCLVAFGGVCDLQYASFSKGLGPILAEQALPETLTLNWSGAGLAHAWGAVKYARDLRCYDHSGDGRKCAPFGLGNGAPAYRGPYCSASDQPNTCWFNWNQDPEFSDTPVATDLSRGPFLPSAAPVCGGDVLQDVDEWGKVVALARSLDKPSSFVGMAIYRDVFNGTDNQPFNATGWPQAVLPVTASAGFATTPGEYRRNQCVLGQQCGSGTCVMPSCSSAADCAAGDCIGGICVADRGVCPCWSNSHCGPSIPSADQCVFATGLCATSVPVNQPYGEDQGRQFESAEFPAGATNQWIKLTATANSPLNAIDTTDAQSLYFDLYWHGFEPGTAEQTVFASNSLRIRIRTVGQFGVRLVADIPGVIGEVWSATPLQPKTWYRFAYFASKYGNRAWMTTQARGLVSGLFEPAVLTSAECFQRTLTTALNLPAPGDVWIGTPAGGGGNGFRGRLDNIALWSTHEGQVPVAGCMEATP